MNLTMLTLIIFTVVFIIMVVSTFIKCGTITSFLSSAVSAILGFGLQVLTYSEPQDESPYLLMLLLGLIFLSLVLFVVNINIYYGEKIDEELHALEELY